MARAQGARAQMALGFETVYGTPPVSGFRLMPFARTTLGSEQPLLESELLGYGRDPLAPIKDAVTADGDVVVPIDVEAFGYWLKAAFGQPTTSGTTPKTHTFQSGNWTLPSMSIETAMPEVPRFAMYSGCVLDQLSWQMQRSGLLTASAKLIAQGETIAATTAAGTPTTLGLQRFGHFNGTVKRNGSSLGNVVSAEITYSNNLDRIETIRGDGRIDGADPTMAPIKDAVTADGEVVIPIDVEAFGFWLKAAFGQPTTSGTTPKTHTFQSGNWTLPSMSIETAMPEVPRFAMYSGCVLDQLSWQMQRSGLLTATARLIAQGETIAATTAAGTPTALALQRFGHFNGTVKRNGTALGNVVSAEITYSNNLDRIETIRGDGRIDGADPTMAALTGRIEVRFSDTTLVTQAIDGSPCELEFNYSLGANASFTFTAHAVYLPRPRIEIAGPQGVQASFDWQAAKATSPARMCTAVLINTLTGY